MTFRNFATIFVLAIPAFIRADESSFRLNQIGYYPESKKIAVVWGDTSGRFSIIDTTTLDTVYTAPLSAAKSWTVVNESVKQAEFSAFTTPGVYRLIAPGLGASYPFRIAHDALRAVAAGSMKSFYFQRASTELTAPYAGIYARAAGHPDTNLLFLPSTGRTTGSGSAAKGWYDAGDYGKYVVNGGISVATLLAFHEMFPDIFSDSTTMIPESGNGRNDLLDEVKWELDWFKAMQDTDGGVFFKVAGVTWPGFVMPGQDQMQRYFIGKSTSSALNFCGVMAMAGRAYRQSDSAFAEEAVSMAEKAWVWANAHPAVTAPGAKDSGGTTGSGEYGDKNFLDEFLFSAAQLFITTGKSEYQTYLDTRKASLIFNGIPSWQNLGSFAALSLATVPNTLDSAQTLTAQKSIVTLADGFLTQINAHPYAIPNIGFNWGSNGDMGQVGMVLVDAYFLTKNRVYLDGAAQVADYLLGKNPTRYCFVTGFGSKHPMNIHHRPSGGDTIAEPIPGLIVGGPNPSPTIYQDTQADYTVNEVAINWSAPEVALLGALDFVFASGSVLGVQPGTLKKGKAGMGLQSRLVFDPVSNSIKVLLPSGRRVSVLGKRIGK